MKKRVLSVLLTLAMLVGMLPIYIFAEGTPLDTVPPVDAGKAMIGTTQYESLPHAIEAAGNMGEDTVTIYLGSGEYTLKGKTAPDTGYRFELNGYWEKFSDAANQNLIFIGQGSTKTTWKIGNGGSGQDQSFANHMATITFKNMTLETTDQDSDGFSHCKNITVEDCTVKNRIYNWCHDNAVFRNTVFDVGSSGYALFAYSATRYDFENCIFNLPKNGRAIRGFRDFTDCTVTINFKNNIINSPHGSYGGVIELDPAGYFGDPRNINYIVNFLGANMITDNKVTPNAITCSEWFSITKWRTDRQENALWQTQNEYLNNAFVTDEAVSNHLAKLNISATINFDGTTVWKDGRWAEGHDGTYNDHWKTWGYSDHPNHKERIYSSTQKPDSVKETVKVNSDWSHAPAWSADPNTAYAIDPETGEEYRYWVEWCKYCHHIYEYGKEYKANTCTVTFKVVNGQWDDGGTEDKTVDVALTDGKGTLSATQIPSVGTKPNENYKAGSWNVTPNISADSITENVTYTYTYVAKENYTITVNYVDESNTVLKQAYSTSVQEESSYDVAGQIVETLTCDEKNYIKESVTGDPVRGIANSDKAITVTYTLDNLGGENGPDEIPDKYQKKVTFKVVNGKWNDKSAADKVVYVTLEKDGKWDVTGIGALTAPVVGSKPNDGFKAGSWDTTPPATVSGTDAVAYTYTYARSTTPIVPGDTVNYIVEHYKANADGSYPTVPTDKEILSGKIGDTVTATAKTYDGFCLNPQVSTMSGELVKIEDADDIVTLKLYYDIDVVGEDDDQPDDPDNIPDKYQKKVTFKVVNGKWNDKSAADKVVYVTLEKDGKWDVTGTGALTAPVVGSKPNDGFKAGSWDTTPPATVSGTDAVAYTYTYAKVSVVPVDSSIPQTGDESHILLWGAMMIASMIGMAVLIVSKKRFAYSGKHIR